jgi:hypothetical protein
MNVIRHDAPGKETIALTVEMEQRAFDQSRNVRSPQPTFAVAGIKVFLDATAEFYGVLAFGLKRKFCCPSFNDVGGQRIADAKVHRLNHAGMIPMRQVAA